MPSESSVRKKRTVRLKEATLLREAYAANYSWQRQCESLVEKMVNLVSGESYVTYIFFGTGFFFYLDAINVARTTKCSCVLQFIALEVILFVSLFTFIHLVITKYIHLLSTSPSGAFQ